MLLARSTSSILGVLPLNLLSLLLLYVFAATLTTGCLPFRETSAERGLHLPRERARLDLRALHRQSDQEGPLGVLAFVDGGAKGRQPTVGVAFPPAVPAYEREQGRGGFWTYSKTSLWLSFGGGDEYNDS